MMRISTLFFCILLAAAAVGRYKAEATVRADRTAIEEVERQIAEERQRISDLTLQVEVLESGPRLAQFASHRLALEPTRSDQLIGAQEFAMMIGADTPREPAPQRRENGDFIIHAIAMADFGQSEPSLNHLP